MHVLELYSRIYASSDNIMTGRFGFQQENTFTMIELITDV